MAGADKVAVVFIHGMGEQRRYADTAVLASRLAVCARRHPEFHAGHHDPLVRIQWDDDAGAKEPRPRARASVIAVLAGQDVEFHDAYWAPIVAGKTDFRSMYRWMRGRSWQPFWYLIARWASHAQLKIDVLHENRSHLGELDRALVAAYQDFVKPSGHHRPRSEDSFGAFLEFLRARAGRTAGAPAEAAPGAEALLDAARRWRGRYVRSMLWALLRTAPIMLAIGAAAVSVPLIGVWIFRRLVAGPHDPATLLLVGFVFLVWLTAFWLARFLTHYLGDVEVYATYNEASERWATREAVLKLATDALRGPLRDSDVSRVVLVAHSLGSVVAWDAVRALALEAATGHREGTVTRAELAKLERIVTYGSPVDKIRFYHFADDGNDPTFRDVLEKLRVDTGHPVFEGGLRWENYYDPADLIGGRLESPNDRWMTHPVRNVAVGNRAFANPFHAHSAYLSNVEVLTGILRAIRGDPPPESSESSALVERMVATALEVGIVTGVIAVFVWSQLEPIVAVAQSGHPLAWLSWLALGLVIAMLAWLA